MSTWGKEKGKKRGKVRRERVQGSTGANAERGTAEASVAGFSSIQSMIATIWEERVREENRRRAGVRSYKASKDPW